MSWELKSDRPIYLQLMESMEASIVSGQYQPGEKLPSVRDLAKEAAVNPNTMQKALVELERNELIFTQRTSGRFVTEDLKLIEDLKMKFAKEGIEELLVKMNSFGISKEELIELIQQS